jgi:hypothetical protein
MRRFMMLLLLVPGQALGQFNPFAPQQNADARWRRAIREQAVAYAGAAARGLVENEGDAACAAIFACSPAGARHLAEFYSAGNLAKLPFPEKLLRAIGQTGAGDDVLFWAVQHQVQLTDPHCLEAYCLDPLQYALGLRPLEEGAAELRARRLSAQAGPPPWQSSVDAQKLALLAGGLLLVGLLWWRSRRQVI